MAWKKACLSDSTSSVFRNEDDGRPNIILEVEWLLVTESALV